MDVVDAVVVGGQGGESGDAEVTAALDLAEEGVVEAGAQVEGAELLLGQAFGLVLRVYDCVLHFLEEVVVDVVVSLVILDDQLIFVFGELEAHNGRLDQIILGIVLIRPGTPLHGKFKGFGRRLPIYHRTPPLPPQIPLHLILKPPPQKIHPINKHLHRTLPLHPRHPTHIPIILLQYRPNRTLKQPIKLQRHRLPIQKL